MNPKLTIKIDVKKISKERLYQGKAGLYLNAILIPTPNNEHGNDYMIVEESTQEERQAGHKGKILGNAKLLVKKREDGNQEVPVDDSDSIPF